MHSINHARTGHSPSHRLVAVALGVVARLPIFGRKEPDTHSGAHGGPMLR